MIERVDQEKVFEWMIHKFGVQMDTPTYESSFKNYQATELLSHMTDNQREVVLLRMELLSFVEIAELLGINRKTAKTWYWRGIENARLKKTPRNRKPNHCINGHEYTPENTYRHPRGHRECRQCRKIKRKK